MAIIQEIKKLSSFSRNIKRMKKILKNLKYLFFGLVNSIVLNVNMSLAETVRFFNALFQVHSVPPF